MGFWKVLGGVAAGVGAVVALPVVGPVSTVIAGAALAGTVTSAAASAAKKAQKESSRRTSEREVTAKYAKKIEKLLDALKDAESRLQDDKSYFQLLIALFAVGMATASADGTVSEEEIVDLEEFTAGVGHSKLPPHVKGTITRLKNNPPNFNTAMKYVQKLDIDDYSLFEAVIEVVSASDGKVTEEERALLEAFRQAVA